VRSENLQGEIQQRPGDKLSGAPVSGVS